MKTELIRKVMLVSSTILIGTVVCVSVWFFLREHRASSLLVHESSTSPSNGIGTSNRNGLQLAQNSDEEQLAKYQRIAQRVKSSMLARYSEEELATPKRQKILEAIDSPAYIEYLKNGPSVRKWNDFLESKGIPVNRDMYSNIFRKVFPTGEPQDYEPEIRLKLAELFIAADPVDLTDPEAAAGQRARVLLEFVEKDKTGPAWYLGYFGEDWDGSIQIEREGIERSPAREWVSYVQRNAASIVAASETAGGNAPESHPAVPAWDMSSVMEGSAAFPDETSGDYQSINTSSTDALDAPAIPNPETDAAATPAPGLSDVPKAPTDLPTVERLEISLKEQFSPERFERAMSTLERYGPEEGLRRLRENDPEVAKQVEQHRSGGEASK